MPADRNINTANHQRESPAAKHFYHDTDALFDWRKLIGPCQVRHLKAKHQSEQSHKKDKQNGNDHSKKQLPKASLKNNAHTDVTEKHRNSSDQNLHHKFCAQRIPRRNRKRLCNPYALSFQRNRWNDHIIHGCDHTDGCHNNDNRNAISATSAKNLRHHPGKSIA